MLERLLQPLSRAAIARSVRRQRASKLQDPALWGARVDEGGGLEIDRVGLARVMEEYGSPVFLVSRSKLVADVGEIVRACASFDPPVRAFYSYKTNGVPELVKQIHEMGPGAEVISPYELWLARRQGLCGDSIVYNGVNKSDESLRLAVSADVLAINADEPEEIDRIAAAADELRRPARVGLRLRLLPGSHFGLGVFDGQLEAGVEKLRRQPRLELSSLHFHLVAAARNSSRHRELTLRALRCLREVEGRLGRRVPYLNLGGGFGVPTTAVMSRSQYAAHRLFEAPPAPPDPEDHQDFASYLGDLVSAVNGFDDSRPPALIIEPGRVAVSRSQTLLSRVHSIKPNPREPHYALTDAGRVLVSYPCDYEYHQIFVANRMREPLTTRYHLMGRLCTSADWLAKNRILPRLSPGDTIAVMDAGAYFFSYSTNFAFPRPPVVMAAEGETKMLRRGETFEHLCAMDAQGIAHG